MIPVIFDPDAHLEFLSAVQYYEDCQKDLGRRFKESIELAVAKIAEAPFRYRVVRAPFRRYLIHKFPYGIMYSIEPDHIRIIAIAHTKRKPGYWLKKS